MTLCSSSSSMIRVDSIIWCLEFSIHGYKYTAHSVTHNIIHSFIAICKVHYVENFESEALEAVARWLVIGK